MKLISFITVLCFTILLSVPVKAQAPYIDLPTLDTPQEALAYYADMYGVNRDELLSTGYCESGFNPKSHNKVDPNGGSKGLMNFQQPTFDALSVEAGIENADVWDFIDNAQTGAFAFSTGRAKLWTTWRAIKNGGSFTFFYKPLNKEITVYCKLKHFDIVVD